MASETKRDRERKVEVRVGVWGNRITSLKVENFFKLDNHEYESEEGKRKPAQECLKCLEKQRETKLRK